MLPGALFPVNKRKKGQTILQFAHLAVIQRGVLSIYVSVERNLGSPYQVAFLQPYSKLQSESYYSIANINSYFRLYFAQQDVF